MTRPLVLTLAAVTAGWFIGQTARDVYEEAKLRAYTRGMAFVEGVSRIGCDEGPWT